ncbi:hypothetical protein NDU88_004359 [Pleurodeles waltl]|uniref:Uncharacterized protein n=1 Tax=Pleurodeles waltl TaxID=8319 RepID=A0AAV7TTW6_PLEWA|nr:hypothetical protein NDU88_004359 [Pleurodeles waltl]
MATFITPSMKSAQREHPYEPWFQDVGATVEPARRALESGAPRALPGAVSCARRQARGAGTEVPVPHSRILLRHTGVQCYWAAGLNSKSRRSSSVPYRGPFLILSWITVRPSRQARSAIGPCFSLIGVTNHPSGWAPLARASARVGTSRGTLQHSAVTAHHRGVPPYLLAGIGSYDRRSTRLFAGFTSLSPPGLRMSRGVGRV